MSEGRLHIAACLVAALIFTPCAQAQDQSQSRVTGPSFPCPAPRDPLAQLICDTPTLSRIDLAFVQAYQSLRQQLAEPALQQGLRQEALDFGTSVRSSCGIALAQPANSRAPIPPPAPPGATGCVLQAYERQRGIWRSRLVGAAAEEAARPIEQQIMLQSTLQRLSFLASSESADGIFGTATRAAIIAWQTSVGRAPTGLLGNSDAEALMQTDSSNLATSNIQEMRLREEQSKATAQVEARRQALRSRFGERAEAIIAGEVQMGMTKDEVLEAKSSPKRRDVLPPNYEIWVYDSYRISFTDGTVTHMGH